MRSLTLDHVEKTYRSKARPEVMAVRDFDVAVRGGELVGLLGPSGCGKSTTLRMIAGLEEVTGGDIRVDDRSVVRLRPQQRNIGVAFENYALYPPLTVRENIAFGLQARGISGSERARRVNDIVDRLALDDIADVRPVSLSSGQKQRVALARAIVRAPDVLLLDEPLSHLDAGQRDTTRRELRRLQQELGYTTVLVTHDQEEALSLADRVVVMSDGLIQQVGTPDEIYDDPANVFVATFVGEPAMNLLEGQVDEPGRVRLGSAAVLPVPTDVRSPLNVGQRLVLGVRPEDIAVVDADQADLVGTVMVYEDLQEWGLLTIELTGVSGRVVAATKPRQGFAPGSPVGLALSTERTYLFDAETEVRAA